MLERKKVEFHRWNLDYLKVFWIVTFVSFVAAMLLFALYKETKDCSREYYFLLFILIPTVAQVVICTLMELYIRIWSRHMTRRCTAMIVSLGMMLLCGVLVMVHTSVREMATLLAAVIIVAAVYDDRIVLIVLTIAAIFIYTFTQIVLLPNAPYLPQNDSAVYILIFVLILLGMLYIVNMIIDYHFCIDREMKCYWQGERRNEEAAKDSLTDLWNYNALNQELEKQMHNLRRADDRCVLVLLDIDGLHLVNERFGHVAGDEVIRSLADAIKTSSDEDYFLSRYSGEEFVIICKNKKQEEVVPYVQSILGRFEEMEPGKTVSAGIAEWKPNIEGIMDFIGRAEQGLRLAKGNGMGKIGIF